MPTQETDTTQNSVVSPMMSTAADAVASSSSLEELSRPFLEILHHLTGLESTYLTEVVWDEDKQRIMFSDNTGNLVIPEGLEVTWNDTLCRRALDTGIRATSTVPETFPGSEAAKALGLQTYVSVPVTDHHDQVMGTLCAASGHKHDVSPEVLKVMELFARLIAEQWQRDRAHAAIAARADRAEEELRSRAMFLAEAEHKLKSPLTILKGWSGLLADDWKSFSDADCQQAFDTMLRASNQMTEQVEELIEEARSQVLTTQLECAQMDVCALVQSVGDEMQGATANHHIATSITEGVQAYVDEHALWQVLWHLGENAIKYSPDGGTIELQVRPGRGEAIITVLDEGLGLPADIDVFQPFVRSTQEQFANIKGNGLGLHVVRNLVRAMRGSVTASRRPTRGSAFEVRVPSTRQ
jgi:K+-sensing histidine kinase KdpD